MLSRKPPAQRGDGKGLVWPGSGTATPDTVGDIFGARPFAAHAYNHDFHRGIDAPLAPSFRAPIAGAVVRLNESCFGFETSAQLAKLTETDTSSCLGAAIVSSNLQITGARVGSVTIASAGRLVPAQRMRLDDDWVVEVQFVSAPSIAGRAGISVHGSSQYAAIEYDGTNVYMHGTDAGGAMAADGTSAAVASATWLRLEYTASTTTLLWRTSADGSTWTTRGTDAGAGFTDAAIPYWQPRLYYRSTDTSGSTDTINVEQWNFVDGQTVSRFGNWLMICDGARTVAIMHFQELSVALGSRVEAGQVLGVAGRTGFDANSGRISTVHAHLEYIPSVTYTYDQNAPVNPITFLPRTNGSNNVSVTRTTANDPDGVSSTKLDIRVARGDQDFDLNQVSCTGATLTRTVNWDTRAGLNADNDIPKQAGVYMVAHAFDSSSTEYHVDFYFNTSVIGTFTSYSILDTAGSVIASG